MRRLAAILVTLTLLLPAAALFAAKPLPCCCKTKQSCPLKKGSCGSCSMSRGLRHPAPASIPFETRWEIETPFTVAVATSTRTYPIPTIPPALGRANAPNTPPPRLS